IDSLWNGHASPQSSAWYASPGVAPRARTVPSPVAFRRDSGRTNTNVPAGASTVSPSTSKVAFPSSTTYSSSWPDPASSCSLISLPSSPGVKALIPNAWIPKCSRTGMSLPRRSMSSSRATRHFGLSFIRSPPRDAVRCEPSIVAEVQRVTCKTRRVRKGLTPDDLGDLLELPLVAVLATYRRDGTVLLSPVWHEWRDNGFSVVTAQRDVKARHLRRDPRASIVVCEHGPPYRGLELRARALLSVPEDQTIIRRVATRYLGPQGGERYAETGGDDLLIRLEPGELRAWDFADYFA